MLWAVRARIGAGTLSLHSLGSHSGRSGTHNLDKVIFYRKVIKYPSIFCLKNKTGKNTEGTEQRFPKQRVQIRLSSSSRSLLHEKRRKGSATCPCHSCLQGPDEVRVSKCFLSKRMQGKSPSKGSPSAQPSQSLTNRCSWQTQSTKRAHL